MLDGLGGAVVGALVGGLASFWIARLVLDRTRRDNESLARESASLEAARELGVALHLLGAADHGLDQVSDAEANDRLAQAADTFSLAVLRHAPALTNRQLRRAVESVSGLTGNFRHSTFERRLVRGGWDDDSERSWAFSQRGDWIYYVGRALIAYRQGEPITIYSRPGWLHRQANVYWRLPPGLHVDGSGRPIEGWEQFKLAEELVWRPADLADAAD